MQKYIDKGTEKLHKVLRWSEKYFETDMVYVFQNGFWAGIGQVMSVGLVFLLSLVFANLLPKDVYGNYKFIISAANILGSFTLSGMATAVVQAVAKGQEGVAKKAIIANLRWGLLTFTLSVCLALYYYINNNVNISVAMIIAGIANPIISSYILYSSILVGKKDFRLNTIFVTLAQAINVLGLILASLITANALVLVVVTFSVNAFSYFCLYLLTIKKYPLNDKHDETMINYGKHVSLMNIFSAITNQIDKILIFHYLGATELAIYSFATAIPEQIRSSYKGLFNIALPKFSSKDDGLKQSLWSKTKKLTLITIGVVIVYIILAPFIYQWFFPKYLESIWYSRFYIIALITVPGISLFSTYFSVKKETNVLYWISIITNSTTLALSFFLIKNYGLFGAVMENTISWTIMLIINGIFFYYRKEN